MKERGYCSSREGVDLGDQNSRQALKSPTWGKGEKEKESMVQPTSVWDKKTKVSKNQCHTRMSFSYFSL